MAGSADSATIADMTARLARHDRDGDDAVLLDETAHRHALALHTAVLGRSGDPTDAATLQVLGRWFLRRYGALPPGSGQADLRSARLYAGLLRDMGDTAVPDDLRALLNGDHDIAVRTNETVLSLLDRFEETGNDRPVAAAAELIRSLETMVPADHPMRRELLSSISRLASARFTIHADVADVEAMERAARAALAGADPAEPATLDKVGLLAWALIARYERTSEPALLDEAQELAEKTLRRHGDNPPPHIAAVLGNVLRLRFEQTHRMTDLDRAVKLSRDATRAVPSGHPILVQLLQTLMMCLVRRVEHLDREEDLTEAIEVSRAMRPLLGPAGPIRCGWLGGLAMLLSWRMARTGSTADLDEAITLSREAVALSRNLGLIRHWMLANHATILSWRFVLQQRREDLTEAIESCRRAIDEMPEDKSELSNGHYATLAHLLTLDARSDGSTADLDEAVALGAKAVSVVPPGHPKHVIALLNLAIAYDQRHQVKGDRSDLDTAFGLWRSAGSSPVGKPNARIQAVLAWLDAAKRVRDLPSAAEAAAAGVALLPVLAWRGLGRKGQERRLARVAGLASEAAALAIAMGRPEQAVELVEQGRSVLWAQAIQTRGDLSALRAVAPDLADRLDETRRSLNQMAIEGEAGLGDQDRLVRAYRQLVERWETLLAKARALPGFGSFLGATPFDELRQAAAGGAVVIVNVSAPRCDALIVRRDGVQVVPLPWLSLRDAYRRADGLLAAVADTEPGGSGLAWTHLRQTLGSLLRWLWDAVAAPVLAELGTDAPQRVWWCPTGPLTLLPLHAAGRYGSSPRWGDRRRPTVPDRTVSSYTTTLGALIRARRRPAATGQASLLAVGMPRTPGRSPLPAVVEELSWITSNVADTRALIGAEATPDAVLAELDRHAWAHFACHATQQVDQPGDSALHLAGGDLSVLRLAGQDLARAEFAYLSACRTAGGSMALADEAINLAAALQLAGYRHVIGTLWPVSDTHAATVADTVYRTLTAGSRPNATHAASALTTATAALRERHPDLPEVWAPFVHLGP